MRPRLRILVVHGRGTKPSRRCKLALIRRVLAEGVRRVDRRAGTWLARHPQTIQLAYYADLSRRLTGEPGESCASYRIPIQRLFEESRRYPRWLRVRAAMQDAGVDVLAAVFRLDSFEFRAVVLRQHFREILAYLRDA